MEQNRFFIGISRINSVLFLLLLAISICLIFYEVFDNNIWEYRNTVEVTGDQSLDEEIENLKLGNITNICGSDVQFVELSSSKMSKGFSSTGYGSSIRNLIFFVGPEMESHWLFDTNKYIIEAVDQLKKNSDKCKNKETVAIYFEVRKKDTDGNGKLDKNDSITIALTSQNGLNYKELDVGVTSVLDHSIDSAASILTLLAQYDHILVMKKYSLETRQIISERVISKIGKKL